MSSKKHIVTCVQCGRRFDASWGGYYNSSTRRYTCRRCGSKIKREQRTAEAIVREERTGMRQTLGAMIAKIAVGLLFVIAAFPLLTNKESGGVGPFLTGLVLGAALIAWGLLPWLKARRESQAAAEAIQAEEAAALRAKLNAPKVCPACGASTKGEKCEYCGAPLK